MIVGNILKTNIYIILPLFNLCYSLLFSTFNGYFSTDVDVIYCI